MRRSIVVVGTLLCGCSSPSHPTSSGTTAGTGAVTPVTDSRQSPVPPDAPCTTSGVTTVFSGDVQNFSVDDHYAYATGVNGLVQIPLDGSAPTTLETGEFFQVPIAVGANNLFLPQGNPPALTSIAINDAPTTPTYGTGLAFDGQNEYFGYIVGSGQSAVAQAPIGGGPLISTNVPIHTEVSAIALGLESIFVAGYTLPDAGEGGPFGSIYSIPFGGGAVTTLITNLSRVNALAVDQSYIYFADTNGADGGVGRMNPDGTNVMTIVSTTATAIAVDSHALYVLKQTITKIDTTTLTQSTMPALSEDVGLWGGLVIHGGNLYLSAESGGALSGPTLPGGLVTLCK